MKILILCMFCILAFGYPSYDPQTSLELARFSDVAYESKAAIQAWTCSGSCSSLQGVFSPQAFENSSDFGFIAYSSVLDAIVVSFRGSNNLADWITNLAFAKTSYSCSRCKVHSGFNGAYEDLKNQVRSLVSAYRSSYPSAKLIMTGHSLGGAIASLAALDLTLNLEQVDAVYTFGSPRVGNYRFAMYYNSKVPNTFRVVNYRDTVAHMPWLSQGFNHNDYEIWYYPSGMSQYYFCTSNESYQCSNSLWWYEVDDHYLSNYLGMSTQQSQIFKASRASDQYNRKEMERLQAKNVQESINRFRKKQK